MYHKLSENVGNLFSGNKGLRKRILITFILIIYIPVAINLYIVYSKTIEVVKKEKIKDMSDVIDKTAVSVELYLSDIKEKISETADSSALRKVVADRNLMSKIYRDKTDSFFLDEFNKLKNDKITSVFCLTSNSESLFTVDRDTEISSKIQNSDWYKSFIQSDKNTLLHNGQSELNQEGINYTLALEKIKSLDNNVNNQTIGTLIFVINSNFWDSLNLEVTKDYNISLYSGDEVLIGNDILKKNRVWSSSSVIDDLKHKKSFTNIEDNTILTAKYLDDFGIYVLSDATMKNFLEPILNSIKNSVLLLLVVGFLAILWIIIEFMVIAKLTSEKQISQLRLMASEEANQKFRIFRHDLMNHLQIIQGLVQMQQYNKALEYSQSLTKESKLIVNKMNIGIPELESAIFQSLSGIEDKNIELKLDFCTLPQDISVKIYDLVKIMVNLIKNAVYALENTECKEKILTIKIYEGVGEYIFEVVNNVPLIPESQRVIIFKKGYTTKGENGSGFGLHIVKTLAEKNMGNVELNVDNMGNHFIVRFPN